MCSESQSLLTSHVKGAGELAQAMALYDNLRALNGRFAKIAVSLARKHCRGSYVDQNDCRWYHESWLFLKQLQMVSHPLWQETFFTRSLCPALTGIVRPQVLICGAADHEMLAVVLESLRHLPCKPSRIVVLDICRTPLYLSAMYADLIGQEVSLVQADALRMPFPADTFHAVTTDAFLTRFSRSERPRIISEWHRILQNGGSVITTARIESATSEKVVAQPLERLRYLWRTARRAVSHQMCPSLFLRSAFSYSKWITSYPFRNQQELIELFHPFETQVSEKWTEGEMKPTLYGQVIATKG